MSPKWMIVNVAGLGWSEVSSRRLSRVAGIDLAPAASVFPAVTCTAQASFRTASEPRKHGMVANGLFDRRLRKASLWEQSSALVEGPRIWEAARAAGRTVGMFFWQQSLGEAADYLISPAPIHFHHGGMAMETYTRPPELARLLLAECGQFPLNRYWGPLASSKVGDAVVACTEAALATVSPDALFVYLPTLDYDLQRFGPADDRCARSYALLRRQLCRLAALAEKRGFEMLVFGDYAIANVNQAPALPNVMLRKAGLFTTRTVRGMAYPDLHASRAFALADHEIAHVYVKDAADVPLVADALAATGVYEAVAPQDARVPVGPRRRGRNPADRDEGLLVRLSVVDGSPRGPGLCHARGHPFQTRLRPLRALLRLQPPPARHESRRHPHPRHARSAVRHRLRQLDSPPRPRRRPHPRLTRHRPEKVASR